MSLVKLNDIVDNDLIDQRGMPDFRAIVCVSQSLSLESLYENHDFSRRLQREDSSAHMTDYEGSVMEGDRRLAMFGWNIEAVTLLLLPMIQTKWAPMPTPMPTPTPTPHYRRLGFCYCNPGLLPGLVMNQTNWQK